jgi:hypothetical protein
VICLLTCSYGAVFDAASMISQSIKHPPEHAAANCGSSKTKSPERQSRRRPGEI